VWAYWVRRYTSSVFQVQLTRAGSIDSGSAFCFARNVLGTCAHVVDGDVIVYLGSDGTPVGDRDVRLHALGPEHVDGALIGIRHVGNPITGPIPIRENPIEAGEQVAALGYATIPLSQPRLSIMLGIVQTVTTDYAGDVDDLVVSIRASGGMSGGPVIDRGGHLVGMITQTTWEQTEAGVPAESFCHVLPVHHLSEILTDGLPKDTAGR
jgi:hypothetical protein